MTPLYLVLAALAGGLPEALPLDGAAHLSLFGLLSGRPAPTIIVAILTGSLAAVLAYQWRLVGSLGYGLYRTLRGKYHPGTRLVGLMLVAAMPGVLADWLIGPQMLPDGLLAIGLALLIGGVLLFFVDATSMTVQRLEHWNLLGALLVGAAQLLAILPGVGRASMTVLIARLLGFERLDSFRLSLLVAIPSLAWLVVSRGLGLVARGEPLMNADAALAGAAAFPLTLVGLGLAGWWLKERGYAPFALWRVLVGGFMIWLSTLAAGV